MQVIDMAELAPPDRWTVLSRLVVPHPLAMITTLDGDGALTVAPLGYCLPTGGEAGMIGLTIGTVRDSAADPEQTWRDLRATGEFVANLVDGGLAEHLQAVTRGSGEGDRTVPSAQVGPPSLVGGAGHLECRVRRIVEREGPRGISAAGHLVIAEVVCVRVDAQDDLLTAPVPVPAPPAVGRTEFTWFLDARDRTVVEHGPVGRPELGSGSRT